MHASHHGHRRKVPIKRLGVIFRVDSWIKYISTNAHRAMSTRTLEIFADEPWAERTLEPAVFFDEVAFSDA